MVDLHEVVGHMYALWKLMLTCIVAILNVIMFINSNMSIACGWIYGSIVKEYDFLPAFMKQSNDHFLTFSWNVVIFF